MTTPARERLATALQARDQAGQNLAAAEDRLTAATQLEQNVRASRDALAALANQAAEDRAREIRNAITAGSPLPASAPAGLVEGLPAAEAELKACIQAAGILSGEHQAARERCGQAEQDIKAAMRQVIAEEAAAAALEGLAALEVVARARRRIDGAERVGFFGGPLPLSAEARAFLSACPEIQDPAPCAGAALQQWVEFRAALEADPAAIAPDGTLPDVAAPAPGSQPGPVAVPVFGANSEEVAA